MSTLQKQLIGAAIGGLIGNFIASVVIEYLAYKAEPKEPGHEEADWLNGDEEDFEPTNSQEPKTLSPKIKQSQRFPKVVDYTKHFADEGRPDIAALAAKYNGKDMPETPTTDDILEEEVTMEIENDDDFDNEIEVDDSVDPAIITMEEYAGDDEFTHVTLKYYEDDVLTDEKGHPIDRPERLLGEEALVSFGELSQDPDIVYVRNREKYAMYEVVRMDKPFAQVKDTRPRTLREIRNAKKEEQDGEDHT